MMIAIARGTAKAAVFAVEQVFLEDGVRFPGMISGTITDQSGRTLTGQTTEAFFNSLAHARPWSIGLNCALGARDLRGYIQDAMNARLMGVKPTGNGRRESYAHVPMPRMTNTYMLGGDMPPEEIVASIQKGLYATHFGGGQVDITSGKFVFSASQAYWVENGKIQYPVKGATLVGNGPDALTRVSLIGNDMALDSGVGTCGKEGQSVPVGVGQPTLRIDGLTVGGTA